VARSLCIACRSQSREALSQSHFHFFSLLFSHFFKLVRHVIWYFMTGFISMLAHSWCWQTLIYFFLQEKQKHFWQSLSLLLSLNCSSFFLKMIVYMILYLMSCIILQLSCSLVKIFLSINFHCAVSGKVLTQTLKSLPQFEIQVFFTLLS